MFLLNISSQLVKSVMKGMKISKLHKYYASLSIKNVNTLNI